MDNLSCRSRSGKKFRVKPPSGGSVKSQLTATSMNGIKFLDSKGNVKLTKLPDHFIGKSPQQVADTLILNPTRSEAVGIVLLSSELKTEFRNRCNMDFDSFQHQIQTKTAHLQQVEASLAFNKVDMKRLHEVDANTQAQLTACHNKNTHLKGQKDNLRQALVTIEDNWRVRQTIIDLLNHTDEMPFQAPSLTEVANRPDISSWDVIDNLSYNATHRAIMVCSVLGLDQNSDFISLWKATSDRTKWHSLFGYEPKVLTGRLRTADEMKIRLAGYLRIDPPEQLINHVLGEYEGDKDSLCSIEEGQEEEEEEVEGPPIPRSIDMPSKKHARSSFSSFEAATKDDLIEELARKDELIEELRKAVEDNNNK